MSDHEFRVETVDYEEYAKELIDGARFMGSDPSYIALGYMNISRIMLRIIGEGY